MPYKKINPNEHLNKTYNRWTVEEYLGRGKRGRALVKCTCQCGTVRTLLLARVVSGGTKSCGCLSSDNTADRNRIHGLSKLPEYKIWKGIKKRCLNPGDQNWDDYGGRGIAVCDEWITSFQAFYEHVGDRPSPKHLIDRIDNSKGYEPGNVRWVTYTVQQRNKRSNVRVMYEGQEVNLIDLCDRLGRSEDYPNIRQRVCYYGWTVEDALIIPIRPAGSGYWSYKKSRASS